MNEPIPTDRDDVADALTRRRFLQSTGSAAAAATAAGLQSVEAAAQTSPPAPVPAPVPVAVPAVSASSRSVTLRVNGISRTLTLEPRVTLLDALREGMGLTGTKKGCDRGQCGACTVLADGRRINACLTLAVMHEGSEITTIEGLGTPDALHPMQAAFIERDAFQCGYCTPGQICSAVACVSELRAGTLSAASFEGTRSAPVRIAVTDAEIRERMSGNLCRCGAYNNIVAAVRVVAEGNA